MLIPTQVLFLPYDQRKGGYQMTQLTWNDVLNNQTLIGGDIESIENGVPYRGPLAKMTLNGDSIRFISPWTAKMGDNGWENWDITSSGINRTVVQPQDIGEGRVFFIMPMLGHCTLFPMGDSKLEAEKVKGLPLLGSGCSLCTPSCRRLIVMSRRKSSSRKLGPTRPRCSIRWLPTPHFATCSQRSVGTIPEKSSYGIISKKSSPTRRRYTKRSTDLFECSLHRSRMVRPAAFSFYITFAPSLE